MLNRVALESLDLSFGQIVVALLPAFLPSRLRVWLYKLLGAQFGKHVSIGIGSIVMASSFSKLRIGDYSSIRNFSVVICREIDIGAYTEIAPFVWIWGAGRLKIGNKCYIGPRAVVNVRRNDFVMGDYAGLGPASMVYTHGQWLPYTQGWPRKYADVVLKDYTWIPARVFISPGVTVGEQSIIASGAVLTKSIPSHVFAGGVPARVISPIDNIKETIDEDVMRMRAMEMARDFVDFYGWARKTEEDVDGVGSIIRFSQRRFLMRSKLYNIIVGNASRLNKDKFQRLGLNKRTIMLSVEEVPQSLAKEVGGWFDLVHLKCGDISNRRAFQMWNFLRRNWCVTCDVVLDERGKKPLG